MSHRRSCHERTLKAQNPNSYRVSLDSHVPAPVEARAGEAAAVAIEGVHAILEGLLDRHQLDVVVVSLQPVDEGAERAVV